MLPIIVASRGRAGSAKFLERLNDNEYLAIIAAEPQEVDKYRKAYPKLQTESIIYNDKGLGFARMAARTIAYQEEWDQYWIIDDDMQGFYRREGQKLISCPLDEALEFAEAQFETSDVAYGSLEYRQLAWSANRPLIFNSFCDGVYYLDESKLEAHDIQFDKNLPGKVDRDFAMQVIKAGLKTARTTMYAFSTPLCGTNAGGQKEIMYDKGLGEVSCQMMVEKWGSRLVTPVDKGKGGATSKDIKIHWDLIRGNDSVQTLF